MTIPRLASPALGFCVSHGGLHVLVRMNRARHLGLLPLGFNKRDELSFPAKLALKSAARQGATEREAQRRCYNTWDLCVRHSGIVQ
jgi:hypothetical protein